MMKLFVFFCIALVSSQTTTICNCAADYHPVCDATGKQYSNQCQADCAGAKNTTPCPAVAKPISLFKDLLKNECICTMEYSPVCDANGKLYSNKCAADCAGAKNTTACPAAIKPMKNECLCNLEYSPVCDASGKQYSNQCQADCAGAINTTTCPADNDDEDDEDDEN